MSWDEIWLDPSDPFRMFPYMHLAKLLNRDLCQLFSVLHNHAGKG